MIKDNKTPEADNQRHAPEHDHRYEEASIKAMRQDVADNPDLSAAPAQAQHSPQYKLGPAEREEVNSLMESAQEDLESVLYQLVWQRDDAKAHAQRLADALRDCETSDGATAFVHPKYAPQRLRAINELVREALAEWSKQK